MKIVYYKNGFMLYRFIDSRILQYWNIGEWVDSCCHNPEAHLFKDVNLISEDKALSLILIEELEK